MFDRDIYDEARREFLAHLRYTKGHRKTTCYAYHSDLGLWADWLQDAGKLGTGVRAEAHLRGSQINNARLAYTEYRADPVLQAAGGALGESVNRHGMYESSLDARITTLERQAMALLASGR